MKIRRALCEWEGGGGAPPPAFFCQELVERKRRREKGGDAHVFGGAGSGSVELVLGILKRNKKKIQ